MKNRLILAALALLSALLSALVAPAAVRAGGDPAAALLPFAPFSLDDPSRIQAGKRRFGSNCAAYCHGAEGEGGKTPRFKGRSDFLPAEAYQVITQGRTGTAVMPPWGKAFTPEQVWELVAYLQFLAKQPAPEQP